LRVQIQGQILTGTNPFGYAPTDFRLWEYTPFDFSTTSNKTFLGWVSAAVFAQKTLGHVQGGVDCASAPPV
jgi:hypothetical protein